eukprot:CAMPEP_0198152480 /NCGR_PEP_ID=MMETSP1443-20131203/59990_1 /TAXON_ID=186043 /ORGANISM="Entomoneis sp., Strain CCMP2396" /LENGTH=172 /DNA_ID=CAMNT_0043818519 /DNA_START=153 /DNA_END=668 /DNA_ORIENTATION=+
MSRRFGPHFVYYERYLPMGFKDSSHMKAFSAIPALLVQVGIVLGLAASRLPGIGKWIANSFSPVGTGMSDADCQNGFVEVYAEVESPPDNAGKVDKANCFLKFKGDACNWVTAQCVCEAALCLLLDRDSLPPKSVDGFGSPAEILGGSLLKRLMRSKVRQVQCTTNARKATD